MSLGIKDLLVYVPAKDFERSKRFYSALGFHMSEGWGGTADFELSGQRFRLQDHYVKGWADNFMIVIGVDDIEAWHDRGKEMLASNDYPGMRVTPPEAVDSSHVLHIVDPSGVLLIFVS